MPESVLEAIKRGIWDFEPEEVGGNQFASTESMPGTKGKLSALAERVRSGLPPWHPSDRVEHDAPEAQLAPLEVDKPSDKLRRRAK